MMHSRNTELVHASPGVLQRTPTMQPPSPSPHVYVRLNVYMVCAHPYRRGHRDHVTPVAALDTGHMPPHTHRSLAKSIALPAVATAAGSKAVADTARGPLAVIVCGCSLPPQTASPQPNTARAQQPLTAKQATPPPSSTQKRRHSSSGGVTRAPTCTLHSSQRRAFFRLTHPQANVQHSHNAHTAQVQSHTHRHTRTMHSQPHFGAAVNPT